ncbi:MAG: IS1 family transposase, partial [Candidatus Thiosymbion ectosymbiont of Robbea hypermnestra]|nr:IS1 family transposase [Candidatus Thiosymbion ectosymbiont of Robbea hypermnestra]
MDEVWSFVLCTTFKVWGWIALNRKTREIIAYACGDRSEKTCRILWDRIPPAYRKAIVFTDYWKAYQAVIPAEQHRPVGKETGETACL